ncbi:MAG: methyl-accepting chemotaxis protein [Alicyclobacillus macrosporangiidus]|uniref:methyl-accepting chemotaxis protein n=1 Tax=Alicyclobacillus macrosporangiidus TaxID=392015 RepID=UPI0026F21388|nr:methyl-accepting chemotaxis protein [Alicyclobacillus macrosporangiidus]MCL6597649.1 methyl-accepting chemotaxis protein [Alicyclobacillus macrosporangiidus]
MEEQQKWEDPGRAIGSEGAVPSKPAKGGIRTRWRQWLPEFISIKWKVGGAFLTVLAVLAVLGSVSLWRLAALNDEIHVLVNHDMKVVQQTGQVMSDLQDMQNGMLSYLVTGNDTILTQTYTAAKNAYPSDIQALQNLLKGNATALSYLQQFAPSIDRWVSDADNLIHMRQAGHGDQANNAMASGNNRVMMSDILSNLSNLVSVFQSQTNQTVANLTRMVDLTRTIVLVLMLAAIAVTVLLGTGVSLSTPRNLRRVIGILEDIASAGGDLRRRIEGVHSRDEVQKLAETTNRLLESIGGLVRRVAGASESVAASAEQLTASTDETARAVSGIAETASEFASISDRATQALGHMRDALSDVKAHTDQVAEQADQVAEAMGVVVAATDRGRASVQEARSTMSAVHQAAESTQGQIAQLAESAQRISKISGTIRGIADQTNLLALNAAIEAARAGEAGRGFAVVAQEVRKLAEQSRDATREIEQIIKENQALTEQVAQSMRDGVSAIARGVQVTERTRQAFDEIARSVDTVAPATEAILEQVREQTRLTQQTLEAVQSVWTYMEQVAAGSQENAASTEESLATVEEIAASAQELARLAQELQDLVGRFQV